jgi:hypothetical protein
MCGFDSVCNGDGYGIGGMVMMHNVTYHPGKGVVPYLEDKTSSVVLLTGPIASGKTTATIMKKLLLQSNWVRPDKNGKRRSKFLVVCDHHWDSVRRAYMEWMPGGEYNRRDDSLHYSFTDGREIMVLFREWKDFDKGCSLELTGAHIENAHLITREQFMRVGYSRVGRFPEKRDYPDGESPFIHPPQIDLTGWPWRFRPDTGEQTWIWEAFMADPRPGFAHYSLTVPDNSHNLPNNYYQRLTDCGYDVSGEWV